jgi:hypothetical protein
VHAVTVRLRARRLFGRNTRCARRIFAERQLGIALPRTPDGADRIAGGRYLRIFRAAVG